MWSASGAASVLTLRLRCNRLACECWQEILGESEENAQCIRQVLASRSPAPYAITTQPNFSGTQLAVAIYEEANDIVTAFGIKSIADALHKAENDS